MQMHKCKSLYFTLINLRLQVLILFNTLVCTGSYKFSTLFTRKVGFYYLSNKMAVIILSSPMNLGDTKFVGL